jgi:hypothetical protein
MSDQHAGMWISFANGKKPWEEFEDTPGDDPVIMLADEREEWVKMPLVKYERMDKPHEECGDSYKLDALWRIWQEEKEGKSWLPLDMTALKT